uniref:ABC transporter G family member 2-like n=1 Tax=Dermatophagoides pteronyssinus TaxID=6956 RepID=A0A6P6YCK8_DERPT|nr:ABC transporter G family member 2-like [Dermatophagoides pteronyssinus]
MIEQNIQDMIVGKMTIRQVLQYAFRLKNDRKDFKIINEHIGQIMEELLLDKNILDKRFEQCSGGEQRRIAIAQELMSIQSPDFLFLDEPTTGLDSNSALLVMQCLRRLVDHNDHLTILVSIHAPSSDILNLFDQLYILAKGGVCIYFDSPTNLQSILEKNFEQELIIDQTTDQLDRPPIEIYLKIACQGIESPQVRKLANSCLHSEKLKRISSEMKNFCSIDNYPNNYKKFSLKDLWLQLQRMFLIVFMVDVRKLYSFIILLGIVIIILTSMFDNAMVTPNTCYSFIDDQILNETIRMEQCLERNWDKNYILQYRVFVTNIIWVSSAPITAISAIIIIKMFKILHNEHRNKWYSYGTFYISFIIVRLIECIIVGTFIALFYYFNINHIYVDDYHLNWKRIGHFIYFICQNALYSQNIGFLIGIIFVRYLEIATIISLVVSQTLHIFMGLFFQQEQLNEPIWKFQIELIKVQKIFHGLLYSFYSVDRCDPETERSYVLIDNEIDRDQIFIESNRIYWNILIIQLIFAIILWLKLSYRKSRGRKFKKSNEIELLTLDYDCEQRIDNENYRFAINLTEINRIKTEKEIEFENFTRNKIMIAWRSINLFASSSLYEIRSANQIDDKTKLILKNLNGEFRFGTLNALMGPSGAGKTSLLKVLNGRMKTKLSEESEFYLTKYCPTRVCYLTQEVSSHLMPGLTALQSLIYASRLKNAQEVNKEINHESIAKNILNELDITDTAETYVQNCSGGERKRLALGLELTSLRMPNLICIDEPTSGLDSNSAEIVIACLLKLARSHNLTIITSIHQPNMNMMMMFDQLYVLAKGGICVYSGRPIDVGKFLEKISDPRINENLFPIEQLMQYSCLDHTNSMTVCTTETENKIILTNDMHKSIDGIPTNRNRFLLKSCWILFLRYCAFVRGYQWIPYFWFMLLIIVQGPSLVMKINPDIPYESGCINLEESYNNTCNRTEQEKQMDANLEQNFLFILASVSYFLSLIYLQCTIIFVKEIRYFWNEHRNGWYSTGVFYMTRMIIEWIPLLITAVGFVYTINIYEQIRPGIYYWLLFLFILAMIPMQSFGYLLVILSCNNFAIIVVIMTVISVIWYLLSDGNAPIYNLHYAYQMISNFVPTKFMNRSFLALVYGFDRCRSKEIQPTLYYYRINDDDFYQAIPMLIMNGLLFHTLSLLILIMKANPFKSRRNRAKKILDHHQTLKPSNVIIPGLGCHHEFTIKKFEYWITDQKMA